MNPYQTATEIRKTTYRLSMFAYANFDTLDGAARVTLNGIIDSFNELAESIDKQEDQEFEAEEA
jgi:hypothetical protein